jgi:hypothetical protein
MKKGKLFTALLLVSIGCGGNISIAATVASKNVTSSHKKNKTVHKTSVSHQRQMSEKDITECTQLIKKVAQTDKVIQTEMIATANNNSKIAEHLKKPADVQLFASDDPAAIAHLTGKSANLPIPSIVKQTAKATPIAVPKPMAQLAPLPIFKPTTATLVATSKPSRYVAKQPTNTKTFVSNDLTAKTLPINPSQPVAKLTKPTTLPVQSPHPHIELFAPNPQVDLNHLEGRSANLATLQKTAPPANKSTAVKPTPSSKKPTVSVAPDKKAKKGDSTSDN